ncbi:DUF4298 domain-containing protein [Neisseria elongata]|uniref:DUF4298 domain-containing protein n=1 Tax=Neisseria elongata TaxID=495 RepID=UPI0028EEBBF4|nr:DUF4298 domain-containing protein [Neisseria elongata]
MELSAEQMQSRLDHIQSCYRRWLELQPKLEAAQEEWRQAMGLMAELDAFYAKEYMAFNQAVSDGLELDERTEGEYRVLSEDALYNAFGEQYELAWQWMRLAMQSLDPANRCF